MLASWQVKAKHVMSSLCCFLPAGLRVSRVSNPAMAMENIRILRPWLIHVSHNIERACCQPMCHSRSLKSLFKRWNRQVCASWNSLDKMEISIYTWNPNDDPCFDWKKALFWGGWPSTIGVIWVLGMYIYIYLHRESWFSWGVLRGLCVCKQILKLHMFFRAGLNQSKETTDILIKLEWIASGSFYLKPIQQTLLETWVVCALLLTAQNGQNGYLEDHPSW